MAESLLITKADIEGFWTLGKNIPNSRVDPHILRSQQSDLKPYLGDVLYYDFVTNIADQQYQDLLNGIEYQYHGKTIFFGGVKPMLCAFSYSRIKRNASDYLTRAGNKNKQTDESIDIPNARIMSKAREADSEAIRLQAEVGKFLDRHRSEYQYWQVSAGVKKSSFKISKISSFKGY